MGKSGLDIEGYRTRVAGAVGMAAGELIASRRNDPRAAMLRMVAAYLLRQGRPTADRRYCSNHGRERTVGARLHGLHRVARRPLLRLQNLHRQDDGDLCAREQRLKAISAKTPRTGG